MEKKVNGSIQITKKTVLGRLAQAVRNLIHPPLTQIRLRGEAEVIYPRMSKGDISYVTKEICRSALRNAK